MESYLIKSSISMIVLYGLYRLISRCEFNHQFNRFTGLACLVFSVAYTFIPMGILFQSYEYTSRIYTVIKETAGMPTSFSPVTTGVSINVFVILYLFGMLIFFIRSIMGMIVLIGYYLHSPKKKRWGFRVVEVDSPISPASFFNLLFMGTFQLIDKEMEAMLVHEKFHRDQYHSIDMLLLEIISIVFWFNPVIWLFRRDIKATHEYLSDHKVLKEGFDLLDYQELLFKTRTGISMQLGNYLSSETSLIKRFKMMTKRKINTRNSMLRNALFLPLMSAIILISACSEEFTGTQPDQLAVYKDGMKAMYKTVSREIRYPKTARQENSSGIVKVSFTVNEEGKVENTRVNGKEGTKLEQIVVIAYQEALSKNARGINDILETEAIRVVENLGNFIPARKDGKPVASVLTLTIQFILKDS